LRDLLSLKDLDYSDKSTFKSKTSLNRGLPFTNRRHG